MESGSLQWMRISNHDSQCYYFEMVGISHNLSDIMIYLATRNHILQVAHFSVLSGVSAD